MECKEKVYKINGVEYKSLNEIPSNLKKFVTPELIEKINKNEGYQSTIISPVSESNFEFKSMNWVLYITGQFISLMENQALRTLAVIFEIVEVNIYLSLFVSFLIGQISYSLAKRYYFNKMENLDIKFSGGLGFIKDLVTSQISSGYSLVLNILFFVIIYLVKQIYL